MRFIRFPLRLVLLGLLFLGRDDCLFGSLGPLVLDDVEVRDALSDLLERTLLVRDHAEQGRGAGSVVRFLFGN